LTDEVRDDEYPVVVVGGGPVGMCTALELARNGVRSLVLERRRRGERWLARTNLTNIRSMEHFRRWGVADRLRANDPVSEDIPRSITWVTALNGYVVTDFERAVDFPEPLPFASERPEWAPNAGIEKTLHEAVAEHPLIDVGFGCEVVGFDQDGGEVVVAYTSGGGERHVSAQYLVAADGSRSGIRRQLGVRMQGQADLVHACIVLIHAPDLMRGATVGRASFYFFINEYRDSAMLIQQDNVGHYMFGLIPASEGFDPEDWEATRTLLFRNVGYEFPVTKVSGGLVRIHSLMAPRFDHGRILLAGDAAHLISPMGGFGMNIGVGDAADVGWKLAAVIKGWGGTRLLESYSQERAAVERWIQEECIDNTNRSAPQLVEEGISEPGPAGEAVRSRVAKRIIEAKTKEFASIGAQLGYRYDDSPVIVDDGSPRPPLSMAHYEPCARPGARAPHVWLRDGVSLFDRFGAGFTLLKLGDVDTGRFESAAAAVGMPLKLLRLDHPGVSELYEKKLVLVRPDQHVAWRGDAVPENVARIIDIVRGA